MAWLLLTLLVLCAITVYLMLTAPEGYQDENGFHYGKPEDNKDFFK